MNKLIDAVTWIFAWIIFLIIEIGKDIYYATHPKKKRYAYT